MSLNEFLVWLSSGGSIVFVSWIAERWAWFQSLGKEAKQWFIYGSSVILSFVAYSVVTFVSPEVLAQLAPFFTILSATFVSVFLGQAFHFMSNKPKQEEKL